MKIILLTQEDPFYLPESTKEFIEMIKNSSNHSLVLTIVSDASPFGKRESFLKKVNKTFSVFGLRFFIYYSIKYIYRKVIIGKSVSKEVTRQGIPLLMLKNSINSSENVEKIRKLEPDVIIIIAGNQIIKKDILDVPKFGVFNAHSSLLPNYKGLMPTFWVLKNNEKKTGVTVYKLTEGIDDGPILSSKEINISEGTTQSSLIKECKKLANTLLFESLELIDNPKNYRENSGGSYYRFPTKSDVREFYKQGKKFF